MAMMSASEWRRTVVLAHQLKLSEAGIAALAIGCPWHGNAAMDFDDQDVFCYQCTGGH